MILISDYLSKKLTFLSFLLIILVVFIHNYFEVLPPEGSFSYILQTTFSKGICYVANSLFFIISGFLFFRKQEPPSIEGYIKMLSKKTYTLVLPYLLVSALILTTYISIGIASYANLQQIIKVWLIEPIPFQLWFLRYLMLMCILSPLIYFLIKRLKYIYIILVFLLWFIFYYKVDHLLVSLTFFSIGAFFSIHGIQLEYGRYNKFILIITTFVWLLFSYLACIVFDGNLFFMSILRNISVVCGLIAIWLLYDYFYAFFKKIPSSISAYSFFIYLFHLPLILYVKKTIIKLIPDLDNSLNHNVSYLLTPILTVVICVIIGKLLKKYLSPVYKLLTGDR